MAGLVTLTGSAYTSNGVYNLSNGGAVVLGIDPSDSFLLRMTAQVASTAGYSFNVTIGDYDTCYNFGFSGGTCTPQWYSNAAVTHTWATCNAPIDSNPSRFAFKSQESSNDQTLLALFRNGTQVSPTLVSSNYTFSNGRIGVQNNTSNTLTLAQLDYAQFSSMGPIVCESVQAQLLQPAA